MVGIIAHDRTAPLSLAEVETLAATYERVRGPGQRTLAVAGSYAYLMKIDTPTASRPGVERGDAGWAAATGVVHGPASLIAADPAHLDGQFALVAYDRQTDAVSIVSDPFGLHAFYVAERAGKTYLSNSALALACHLGAQPDPVGLSMLLCCGTQHGPKTSWEGISRLGPAIALTFTPAGPRQTNYWRLEPDDAVARLSFNKVVDHCIDTLRDLFRCSYSGGGRMWVDLTGGYDTRLLTLLLHAAGVAFHCNTVGAPFAPDVRLGRRVALAAGWDWTPFRVPTDWAMRAPLLVGPALAWADGRLPVVQLTHVLWTQERKARLYPSTLAGGGGEVFRGHAWRQEVTGVGRRTPVNVDRLIHLTLLDGAALAMQHPSLTGRVVEYLRAVMVEQIRPYASERHATQLDVLLAGRKPVWDGIYGSASGGNIRSELPFLLKRSFTTGFSVEFRYRHHRRLMRAMIERLDPQVARIPTAFGGPTVPWRISTLPHYLPHYASLGRFAADKLSQKVLGRTPWPSGQREDPRIVAGQRAVLEQLALTPSSMLSASLYKPGTLDDALRRAHSPGASMAGLLGRIITVELVLRAANPQ